MSETLAGAPFGGHGKGLFTGQFCHPHTAHTTHIGVPVGNPPTGVIWWHANGIGLATVISQVQFFLPDVYPIPIAPTTRFGTFEVRKSKHYILLPEFQRVFNDKLKDANITAEVAWPNIVYRPKKGVSYLKPENGGRARSPLGFGADSVQQWQGIYQVGVFAPRDTGELEQERLATKVMATFPRGMTLSTVQHIDVKISHSTAPAPVPFGDWSNLPVSIYWFAVEPPL